MSFSLTIQKKNKFLLPLSWLYQAGVWLFSMLYDYKILKSVQPVIPVICIGNLSVGGTGKSPMVEYMVRLLQNRFSSAIVSRGYKRKTNGFFMADATSNATDIGDEPMQFHIKFPKVTVVVDEKRAEAIEKLQHLMKTQAIILDDAFQHRAVNAGLNIVLTECGNLFTNDYYLPAGQLRDLKSNYKRADILVITKCPINLSESEKQKIIQEIKPLSHQTVYFTAINYEEPYHIMEHTSIDLNNITNALLVTGIANPQSLVGYVKDKNIHTVVMRFEDHHSFSLSDIENLNRSFQAIKSDKKIVITTEKDAVRLMPFKNELEGLPIYAIPIEHQFLFDEGKSFDEKVISFIEDFAKKN